MTGPAAVANGTALLVMDVQKGVVGPYGGDASLLKRLGTAIAAAREVGLLVVYVVARFGEGFSDADPAGAIDPAVPPEAGDIVVMKPKRKVSALAESDLDSILRLRGVDTLVLTGISTSGVVLSTLRGAADMGYNSVVLADCCDDRDGEVHRVLVEKVFPIQAKVTETNGWVKQLTAP